MLAAESTAWTLASLMNGLNAGSQVAPARGHEQLEIQPLGIAIGHPGHVVGDGAHEFR